MRQRQLGPCASDSRWKAEAVFIFDESFCFVGYRQHKSAVGVVWRRKIFHRFPSFRLNGLTSSPLRMRKKLTEREREKLRFFSALSAALLFFLPTTTPPLPPGFAPGAAALGCTRGRSLFSRNRKPHPPCNAPPLIFEEVASGLHTTPAFEGYICGNDN